MVSLAVQATAHSQVPVGIIPAGTGNDLARDYEIPLGDPEAAADVVAAGLVEVVDLGRVTPDGQAPQVFGSILCAGLDSKVNRRVNEMRLLSGPARYVIAALMEFPFYRPRRFRMTFDAGLPTEDVVEAEVLLSAFAITRSYGGDMRIAPDADRSDGLLDVVYVVEVGRTPSSGSPGISPRSSPGGTWGWTAWCRGGAGRFGSRPRTSCPQTSRRSPTVTPCRRCRSRLRCCRALGDSWCRNRPAELTTPVTLITSITAGHRRFGIVYLIRQSVRFRLAEAA
ncbi:diacylglycerol kinase family protein [Dietzia aerolata]